MNCGEVNQLLDLYLDEELPQPLADLLEEHLFRCADCSHRKQTLEQTLTWLREAGEGAQLGDVAFERVLSLLRAELADRLWSQPIPATHQLILRLDG